MTEMANNFGETSFVSKIGTEATKSFVSAIAEK
jgi:hypothetical protein